MFVVHIDEDMLFGHIKKSCFISKMNRLTLIRVIDTLVLESEVSRTDLY